MKTLVYKSRQLGFTLYEAIIAMLCAVFINFKLINIVWNNTQKVKINYLQWRQEKLSEIAEVNNSIQKQ